LLCGMVCFLVVVPDVVLNSLKKFKTISARIQVNTFMPDAFPEAFNPDIIDSPAFPIHRDFDVQFPGMQGPKGTGITGPLIAVDDLGHSVFGNCVIRYIFTPLASIELLIPRDKNLRR